MSDPYERVKGGRLSFKGGSLATRTKTIDKNKSKKKKKNKDLENPPPEPPSQDNNNNDGTEGREGEGEGDGAGEVVYTIDAAKRMKYEELFPVETKKFGYDPKSKSKSIEDALDDRVKKKADRYCK